MLIPTKCDKSKNPPLNSHPLTFIFLIFLGSPHLCDVSADTCTSCCFVTLLEGAGAWEPWEPWEPGIRGPNDDGAGHGPIFRYPHWSPNMAGKSLELEGFYRLNGNHKRTSYIYIYIYVNVGFFVAMFDVR